MEAGFWLFLFVYSFEQNWHQATIVGTGHQTPFAILCVFVPSWQIFAAKAQRDAKGVLIKDENNQEEVRIENNLTIRSSLRDFSLFQRFFLPKGRPSGTFQFIV